MMVGGSQYGGHHHIDPNQEMSFALDRDRHHSTADILDSIERRTQRTYRYGIGLVCIGATLNWLGFAQGNSYIDPLRYLGVACVISGSFCVCLAMCRWLGRPISMNGHRVSGLEEDSLNGQRTGDVHVINVAVPMYMPSLQEEYRPSKPPDYEIVAGEPPPYDEAIKLHPGTLFPQDHHRLSISDCQCGLSETNYSNLGQGQEGSSCNPSPSHSAHSTCPLLFQSKRGSVSANGSPPPPYHPSPSRFLGGSGALIIQNPSGEQLSPNLTLQNQTETRLNLQNSYTNSGNNTSSSGNGKYQISSEQEHFLGMMLRGQKSPEDDPMTPSSLVTVTTALLSPEEELSNSGLPSFNANTMSRVVHLVEDLPQFYSISEIGVNPALALTHVGSDPSANQQTFINSMVTISESMVEPVAVGLLAASTQATLSPQTITSVLTDGNGNISLNIGQNMGSSNSLC